VGINNGLADEVQQHPIVVGELVRPITTDINAIVTAAPQQRLEIHDCEESAGDCEECYKPV
jgi:hypothetical protein